MRVYARMFSRKEGKGPLARIGEQIMPNPMEFLTAKQLANLLGLRPDTIRLWTRESIIPAIHVTGKVIRYDPAEVHRALRKRSDDYWNKGGQR